VKPEQLWLLPCAQVEPRLAGGNAEREPTEKESLDYFREATHIPFLSAGGFSRQAAIDAVQANKADGIVFGEGHWATLHGQRFSADGFQCGVL
jgi:hypothetical protein